MRNAKEKVVAYTDISYVIFGKPKMPSLGSAKEKWAFLLCFSRLFVTLHHNLPFAK